MADHVTEHIFCLKCSASTEDKIFCKCSMPDMFNWMVPSSTLAELAVPKNWEVVQLRDSPADIIHDGKL